MRFARLQLRNETWAEDAVSETLLAALAKPQAFQARSQLKTWLVGILKHKIIDAMRLRQREVVLNSRLGRRQHAIRWSTWRSRQTATLPRSRPTGATPSKT